MSLQNIKPYFRSRLDFLNFKEWDDAFTISNIPETITDRSYHILIKSFDGGPINHTDQQVNSDVVVSLITKGYRNSNEAIDDAILNTQNIISDICAIKNRTSQVLNIIFDGAEFEQINSQNDNSVLVILKFSAIVLLNVDL